MDYAALLVDFALFEQQAVGPVVQDVEAGIDVRGRNGHIVDVVNCLVGRGVGVEVLAELNADAFAEAHDAVAGEVLRAVEAHVFEEVGETALRLFFLHRTYLLRDVETGAVLRQFVVTDVIRQSVGQFAVAHFLVNRQLRHLRHSLCVDALCRHEDSQCKERQEDFLDVHNGKILVD